MTDAPPNGSNDGFTPANNGARWSEEEDIELRRRIEARETGPAIARGLKRTQDGVRGRAAQLGLTLPSSLNPWRRLAPDDGRSTRRR